MSIIYPVLAEASFNCEKSGRETFLPDVGQRSRATIPGDDPGEPAAIRGYFGSQKGRCQDGGAMEGVGLFWEQITAAAVGRVMGYDPIVE
jgi:hypothetical protein